MTRSVIQVRLSVQEKERWQGVAGKNLSEWLRQLAREECERVEAEESEVKHEREKRLKLKCAMSPQGGLHDLSDFRGPDPK